jgi:putative exosortase-associated protein (TIGR04073 family)
MAAVQGSAVKLARGIANIGLGWIDLPKQTYLIGRKEGWLRGLVRGPIDGFGLWLARAVAGGYEILTFPVPVPKNYQPLIRPDYAWQPEPEGE